MLKSQTSSQVASFEASLVEVTIQLRYKHQNIVFLKKEMTNYLKEQVNFVNSVNVNKSQKCFSKKRRRNMNSFPILLQTPSDDLLNSSHELYRRSLLFERCIFESIDSKILLLEKLLKRLKKIKKLKQTVKKAEVRYLNSLSSSCFMFKSSQKTVENLQNDKNALKEKLKNELSLIKLQSNILLNDGIFIQQDIALFNVLCSWKNFLLIILIKGRILKKESKIWNLHFTKLKELLKKTVLKQRKKNHEISAQLLKISKQFKKSEKSNFVGFRMFGFVKKNKKGNEIAHPLHTLDDLFYNSIATLNTSPNRNKSTEVITSFADLAIKDVPKKIKKNKRKVRFEEKIFESNQSSDEDDEEVLMGAEYKGYMSFSADDDLIDSSCIVRS